SVPVPESFFGTPRVFRFTFLPSSAFLQCVHNFSRHISLIVLGKDCIGGKYSTGLEVAFYYNSLPFSKQVRDNTLIAHRNVGLPICHREAHLQIIAAFHTSLLYKAANAHAGTGSELLFDHVGRRTEEYDRITQCAKH